MGTNSLIGVGPDQRYTKSGSLRAIAKQAPMPIPKAHMVKIMLQRPMILSLGDFIYPMIYKTLLTAMTEKMTTPIVGNQIETHI